MSQFINDTAVWRYNDCEFTLDLSDTDTIALYEKSFKQMQEDVKKMPKEGTKSEIVRAYCQVLRDVFDRLIGDGTSDKLFGNRYNALEITTCYENFLEFVDGQNKAIGDLVNRMTTRYSPNRAKRRHPGN